MRVDEEEEPVEEEGAAARCVHHIDSIGRAHIVVVHIQRVADIRVARILYSMKKRESLLFNKQLAVLLLPAIRQVESRSPRRLPSVYIHVATYNHT